MPHNPPAPHKPTSSSSSNEFNNGSVTKRLLSNELMTLMMSSSPGISAFPKSDANIFEWVGTIEGPPGTYYQNLAFKVLIVFPPNYPYVPPIITFDPNTPCYHPNVDIHGGICLDILKEKWSAVYSVHTILLSLQSLLGEPNNSSPLNVEAAGLWNRPDGAAAALLELVRDQQSAMPLVHAGVFAIGAAVGAASVFAITRRQQPALHAPLPKSSSTSTALAPSSDLVSRPQITDVDVLKYGNPGPIADLLARKAYVAAYDRRLRHPAWTAEHLTRASLGRSLLEPPDEEINGDRSKSTFEEDKSIPDAFRARISDYFRSGYDRGHMVPAADAKMSQAAMNETFLLSNIAPQVGDGFNRNYWAYLERWCRDLTLSFSDVYVFTIPLYLPSKDVDGKYRVKYEVIGTPPNIAVPTHFAKVVLTARPASPQTPHIAEISTGAFVLPNKPIPDETPLESFTVPVDAVEKAAGLQLFPEQIKQSAKHICQTTECKVVVKRFNDAQRSIGSPKSISSKN